MPRADEIFLLECLVELIGLEKEVEVMKINLALRQDFNLMDAFGLLDRECRSEVNPTELRQQLAVLGLRLESEDLTLVFHRYADTDTSMCYTTFTDAFLPCDEYYCRLLIGKRLSYH